MAKQKPMILPDYEAEMQDEIEALIARNRALDEGGFDPMFIDGYSQVMQANDIAKADDIDWAVKYEKTGITKKDVYKIIGAQPRDLPLHFTAIRVKGMDGTHNANVSRDMAEYTRWGYRPAKLSDFEKYGWKPPLGYTAHSDGTLHRDDLQLFVVDARAEKARRAEIARKTAEAENPNVKVERHSGTQFMGTAERRREEVTYDTDIKDDNE